jgi:AcrR family transcriptional regulator
VSSVKLTALDARTRILAAARERLQGAPLGEVTLSGVARTAGLSRQTVYQHFADRDDLLASVFIDFAEARFAPAREELMAGALDADALEAVFWVDVEASRSFFSGGDSAGRPAIAEFILSSERMRAYEQAIWVPVLERFAAAGAVRAGLDLPRVARWLSYQQTWLVTHPALLGGEDAERAYVREFVVESLFELATARR